MVSGAGLFARFSRLTRCVRSFHLITSFILVGTRLFAFSSTLDRQPFTFTLRSFASHFQFTPHDHELVRGSSEKEGQRCTVLSSVHFRNKQFTPSPFDALFFDSFELMVGPDSKRTSTGQRPRFCPRLETWIGPRIASLRRKRGEPSSKFRSRNRERDKRKLVGFDECDHRG